MKKTKKTELKAVGITCGIGSMLVGARQAGFKVVGNVEWRRYYHAEDERGRNTFKENFPGATFPHRREEMTEDEFKRFSDADLALGHPECGSYSQLSSMNPDKSDDPGDIPLFCDLVADLRPRFFAMDDLPKSFKAFSMSDYHERLPGYDLFPEWVSNYHYGNVQKNRRRMFMIGARREERFAFRPGEFDNRAVLRDVLEGLGEPGRSNYPNHEVHSLSDFCARAKHLVTLGRDREATFGDLRDYFLSLSPGVPLEYASSFDDLSDINFQARRTGRARVVGGKLVKHKPGHTRADMDWTAYVLDGASVQVHPTRGLPYTIRERARIQGFPDDFVFYGTKFDARGEWNHEKNNHLVKQTGKAMPVQFCRYVSSQVAAKIRGEEFRSSGHRMIPPNPYVDDAKKWYCSNVGYSDQVAACGACWMRDGCEIRRTKYGIQADYRGHDAGGQARILLPARRRARLDVRPDTRDLPRPRGDLPSQAGTPGTVGENRRSSLAAEELLRPGRAYARVRTKEGHCREASYVLVIRDNPHRAGTKAHASFERMRDVGPVAPGSVHGCDWRDYLERGIVEKRAEEKTS